MARITPFGVLSACHGARHGEIAVAMAAEFGDVDVEAVDDGLDALAVALAGARAPDAVSELIGVGDRLAALLDTDGTIGRPDIDDLLVPPVLVTGTGHELALVQVAVEAARRAGISLDVIASGEHLYLAHERSPAALLLAPHLEWRALDAADLAAEGELVRRCSHEVAYLVLGAILRRTRATGVLPTALRASSLRLKLPLDERMLDRLRVEDARLRAQLN